MALNDNIDPTVSEGTLSNSSYEPQKPNHKNKAYWALPENVRHALDIANNNKSNSDFYTQLCQMNDKIDIYKKVFYTNQPKFERVYNQKKRQRLEEQMDVEHSNF